MLFIEVVNQIRQHEHARIEIADQKSVPGPNVAGQVSVICHAFLKKQAISVVPVVVDVKYCFKSPRNLFR